MAQAKFNIVVEDSPAPNSVKVGVSPGQFDGEALTDLERAVLAEHVFAALVQIHQAREHKKYHERIRDTELAERQRNQIGDDVPEIGDLATGGKVGIC